VCIAVYAKHAMYAMYLQVFEIIIGKPNFLFLCIRAEKKQKSCFAQLFLYSKFMR